MREVDALIAGRYRRMAPLHRGTGVCTYLGRDRDDRRVVIKQFALDTLSSGARFRIEHDASLLQTVRSDALAQVRDFMATEELALFVFDYIEGETLESRFHQQPLTLLETLRIGIQIFEGLERLHEKGLLHRDVKSSNVILQGTGDAIRATLVDACRCELDGPVELRRGGERGKKSFS